MKEEEIFEHGWIDPKIQLPEDDIVDWYGKPCDSPKRILLLRKLEFRDGVLYVVSVGEYDRGSIPFDWRTWDEHKEKDGSHEPNGTVVYDVIAWRPHPPIPDDINYKTEYEKNLKVNSGGGLNSNLNAIGV